MKLENKVILMVGASQGIARAMALQLAGRNNTLILTARNLDGLKEVKKEIEALGSVCDIHAADAADEKLAAKIVKQSVKSHGRLDVAILNAGGAWPVVLPESTVAELKHIIEWNVHTVLNYFMPAMQQMKTQPEGGIIAQTNSLAGFQGLPFTAAYSGAKAAMRNFFDGARVELKKFNIRLVTLCPGFVSTRAHEKGEAPTPFIITPEKAAKIMVKAIEKEKRTRLFPLILALGTRLGAFMPAFITDFIFSKQKLNTQN